MRLIDADALERVLEMIPAADIKNIDGQAYVLVRLSQVLNVIKNAPTIEPEHKRGKWIPENRTMDAFWVCSSCGFPSEAHAANILYKYCPNCGAKMEEGRQE